VFNSQTRFWYFLSNSFFLLLVLFLLLLLLFADLVPSGVSSCTASEQSKSTVTTCGWYGPSNRFSHRLLVLLPGLYRFFGRRSHGIQSGVSLVWFLTILSSFKLHFRGDHWFSVGIKIGEVWSFLFLGSLALLSTLLVRQTSFSDLVISCFKLIDNVRESWRRSIIFLRLFKFRIIFIKIAFRHGIWGVLS